MRDLRKRTALISGGTSGIGGQVLAACREVGMSTMSVSRGLNGLTHDDRTVDGPSSLFFKGDVTRIRDLEGVSDTLVERGIEIDALICNAGIGHFEDDFLSQDMDIIERVLAVNLNGALNCLRAFDRNLNPKFSDVIFIGSIAGRRSYSGSIYSVSKSALDSLVANYRNLVEGRSIRVTQVIPGTVSHTRLFGREVRSKLQPSDIARSVLFCLRQPLDVQISELVISEVQFSPAP